MVPLDSVKIISIKSSSINAFSRPFSAFSQQKYILHVFKTKNIFCNSVNNMKNFILTLYSYNLIRTAYLRNYAEYIDYTILHNFLNKTK